VLQFVYGWCIFIVGVCGVVVVCFVCVDVFIYDLFLLCFCVLCRFVFLFFCQCGMCFFVVYLCR